MDGHDPKNCFDFSILRVIIQAGTVSDTIKKESFLAPRALPHTVGKPESTILILIKSAS